MLISLLCYRLELAAFWILARRWLYIDAKEICRLRQSKRVQIQSNFAWKWWCNCKQTDLEGKLDGIVHHSNVGLVNFHWLWSQTAGLKNRDGMHILMPIPVVFKNQKQLLSNIRNSELSYNRNDTACARGMQKVAKFIHYFVHDSSWEGSHTELPCPSYLSYNLRYFLSCLSRWMLWRALYSGSRWRWKRLKGSGWINTFLHHGNWSLA